MGKSMGKLTGEVTEIMGKNTFDESKDAQKNEGMPTPQNHPQAPEKHQSNDQDTDSAPGQEAIPIGWTRDIDSPSRFLSALLSFRGKAPHPFTFHELAKLHTRGHPQRPPEEGDSVMIEVYQHDPVLNTPDDELRAHTPHIAPADVRRLRRAFLFREARQAHQLTHAYETKILNHLCPLVGSSLAPLDYEKYLLAFHQNELEAFFSVRALPVSLRDLKAHSYIAAGSGHGKSELIKATMYQLMQAGHGVILLDPHGDIAEQVTHWQEFKDHPERLCYFAPYLAGKTNGNEPGAENAHHGHTPQALHTIPVINPLAVLYGTDDLDSAVENFIATMAAVIGSDGDMSTRMKTLLRPCLYTLARVEGASLYDLMDFLSEDTDTLETAPWVNRARNTLTNRAQLDTLASFFDRHYVSTKNAIRDRLRALLASDALERCLTGKNTIDLESLMNSGKAIVFNLSAGQLGNETSAGFGRFILCALQNAAMRRQSLHASKRKSVFLFIDEADRFMSDAVVSIYKETRKYGLHLTLAQQITGYGMSDDVWRAVSGNSRVRFAGASGGDQETARDLEHMTGVDRATIKALAPLNFYVQSGNHEAVKFTLGKKLLGHRHTMNPDEWERVKAYQLATYYRAHQVESTGKNPPDSPQTQANLPPLQRGSTNQAEASKPKRKNPFMDKPPIDFG